MAHALFIESVKTLLMAFARSRDEGKCIPGDYANRKKERKINVILKKILH